MATNQTRRVVLGLKVAACIYALWGALGGPWNRAVAQNLTPDEAVHRMKVPPGVKVDWFASEPMVRQPVAMTFDDRGRLWVVQYLQYPNPAGLKRVTVDRYSRTVYDRVPEPPPRGPRGADRITILDDTDGDGRADKAKDFVDGLNLASGLAIGYGGLFVIQTPYLLFYADRDGDDVPDGDPQVLLSGFGMEDAHSVANSLVWGPDGWLYGAQGSTVTANIRGISFQQGIWRYHPRTDEFELFAEGGGNTWGVDFDARGELIAGTNVGPNAMLHQVQGGYYWKSFGKHGALHNPYTFGYLEHVPYSGFVGGHVTNGGIVYQGTGLPPQFSGRYIAANLLAHSVHWHELEPNGSSFVGRHGGELLVANDPWFAPVDICAAPDGSLLIADWHDQRTAHPDPDAEWDRTNGRIYRLQGINAPRVEHEDLRKLITNELIKLLESPSGWHRGTARRLLGERRDPEAVAALRERLKSASRARPSAGMPVELTLEYLWALYVCDGLDDEIATLLLDHAEAAVRGWSVRLLADRRGVSPTIAARLAKGDESPIVRSRLASAAQRLPGDVALPIIVALMRHDEDLADQQLPLLIWWALEPHADNRAAAVALFDHPGAWRSRLAQQEIAPRLARRYAAAGSEPDLEAAARLAGLAAKYEKLGPDANRLVLGGIASGVAGRRFNEPPKALAGVIDDAWRGDPLHPVIQELGMRLGYQPARQAAKAELERAADSGSESSERLALLLGLVSQCGRQEEFAPVVKRLAAEDSQPLSVRQAAIAALAAWSDEAIAVELLAMYPSLEAALRESVRDALVSRRTWGTLLVDAAEKGSVASADVSPAQLRRLAEFHDSELDQRILTIWGQVRQGTPEERLAVVRRLNNDLRAALGETVLGKKLFAEHCGTCHKLHGEGNTIGPDLTTANRQDRDFLLVSLVDPSAHIRKEYMNFVCQTTDGRVLTGLVIDESAAAVTLVDAKNQRTTIPRDAVAELEPADASLMPEGILEKLTPQQLRDLFAYLQN